MSVNKVILVGRVGKDAELVTFGNGGKIAKTSLATTEKWKDKQTQEAKEKTTWHNITFPQYLADTAVKFVKKGTQIYIEGRIENTSKDRPDGTKEYFSGVNVVNMQLLGSKNDNQQSQAAAAPATPETQIEEGDDDLPF
jgi:single-strand DNA-binding protein